MNPPSAGRAERGLRLSASARRPSVSRTPIGALQAGVLRREPPGSPNTRFGQLGETGQVLVDEGIAGAAEAGEPILDVGGIARLRHLAVVDEVDAGLGLLLHHLGDRRAHARRQRRAVDRHALLLGVHHPDEVVRSRQAAGMGGQEALAALRVIVPPSQAGQAGLQRPRQAGRPRGHDHSAFAEAERGPQSTPGDDPELSLAVAPRPASVRLSPPRPAPAATRARRSCSRVDHLGDRAGRPRGSGNRTSPDAGWDRISRPAARTSSPCFSSTFSSSRSVSSTPSSSALSPASAFSRSSASSAAERGPCCRQRQDVARKIR